MLCSSSCPLGVLRETSSLHFIQYINAIFEVLTAPLALLLLDPEHESTTLTRNVHDVTQPDTWDAQNNQDASSSWQWFTKLSSDMWRRAGW
jgi:hypothetical protein